MKIIMHGAAGCVTGSAYEVQTERSRLLVDFGLFQGRRTEESRNDIPQKLKPGRLNAVLLTHAHLDHTGRLPLLVKAGYRGPVYCTPATIEVTGLILRDSAKVQAQDAARMNRRRERSGRTLAEPMYTIEDVEALMPLFRPVPYDQAVEVAPGMKARFAEAGHLLGSASIELTVEADGRKQTVVFSGDLGPVDAPILQTPKLFSRADLVFLESTYGDRDHKSLKATVAEFEEIVKKAVARKGKILIPTFAVGRAQLLLYLLAIMFRNKTVPRFPVFLDSPMAIDATRIYLRHPELHDGELQALKRSKPLQRDLESLKPTVTSDESRALNDVPGPCLILAGAGMCNAGRILHHLRHNLWRPETSVIIVGFQGEGSLGRLLVEGRREVSVFGEKVMVRAAVHTLGGFSAHAGQGELLKWLGAMAPSRPRVVLTHGEDRARIPLAALIKKQFRINAQLPNLGDEIAL